MAEERWAALESNPDVLSKFCRKMGVGEQFEVVDVLGVDPDLLSFVPQPVLSLILLFPSRNSDGSRVREKLDVEKHELADKVFFLKQIEGHLDNACGTIAMIHAILNNKELLGLTDGSSPLEKFLEETSGMSYEERGRHLDNFRPVAEVHNSLVEEGQSRVQSSDNVCHHFVCVTAVEGHMVELDGAYNSGPNVIKKLNEGESLLSCAAEFIKEKYFASDPNSTMFSLMALAMQ